MEVKKFKYDQYYEKIEIEIKGVKRSGLKTIIDFLDKLEGKQTDIEKEFIESVVPKPKNVIIPKTTDDDEIKAQKNRKEIFKMVTEFTALKPDKRFEKVKAILEGREMTKKKLAEELFDVNLEEEKKKGVYLYDYLNCITNVFSRDRDKIKMTGNSTKEGNQNVPIWRLAELLPEEPYNKKRLCKTFKLAAASGDKIVTEENLIRDGAINKPGLLQKIIDNEEFEEEIKTVTGYDFNTWEEQGKIKLLITSSKIGT